MYMPTNPITVMQLSLTIPSSGIQYLVGASTAKIFSLERRCSKRSVGPMGIAGQQHTSFAYYAVNWVIFKLSFWQLSIAMI